MTHCAQDFLSPRRLLSMLEVWLLGALLDRLRLQQGEILISASFDTVQESSTTPVLPFRQYLAATTLVPDYGLGRVGGVASRPISHVVHATSYFCFKKKNCRELSCYRQVQNSSPENTSLSLNLQMVPPLTVSAFDSSMGLSQSEFKKQFDKIRYCDSKFEDCHNAVT